MSLSAVVGGQLVQFGWDNFSYPALSSFIALQVLLFMCLGLE